MNKIVSSEADALAGFHDGACLMVSGFGGAGTPKRLIAGVERTGAKRLTVVINSLRHLDTAAPKMFGERRVVRAVCSAARGRGRTPAPYEAQLSEGQLEVEVLPQGTFAERIRAGGAGVAAFYTPSGAGTALGEGKETREFDGKLHVLEHALRADFAILAADVADEHGNVSFRGTQANFGPAMATAARIAVVEVNRISPTPLDPHRIDLPGIFVQRVWPHD
tara:strand:+ start:835 stop:1497 length:663 start_codon:yes stop_codon:yes gene_type:complete